MFTKPDDLTTLSAADLDAARTEALAEYGDLSKIEVADLTDEQIDRIEYLAAAVQEINAAGDALVTAAAERQARIEAATGVLTAAKAEPKAGEKGAPPVQPAPAAEPGKPAPGTNTPEDGSGAGTKVNQPVPPATEVASTRTSVVAAVRATRNGGEQHASLQRSATMSALRAAADVPGFAAGSDLGGMAGITEAFMARSKTLGRSGDQYQRLGVATLHKDTTDVLTASSNAEEDYKAVWEAGVERDLTGGSLVAAGGWCAPSETFYDLCQTESLDGLVDIPEVNVSRGGIRFTKGPAFEDIYASAGFFQTETQAIAGTAKPCATIACPPFQEIRLDAIGTCVSAPILTNVGYPELVQRWIEGTMVAHEHKKSLRTVNSMLALSGASPVAMRGLLGTGMDTLAVVEWIAETTRYRYRMPFASTLEILAPHWLLPIIRQDLAMRTGLELPQITDQQITALFANRGTRVQWLYDWQPLDTSATGTNALVAPVPPTVELLAYPAGTFVRGTADVISLDTVYDTAGLQQNTYTAVFMEEGMLVANRCYSGTRFSIPVAAQGSTGGALAAGTKFDYSKQAAA